MIRLSPLALLPALGLLAACATPQQQCINSVTNNLQVVDSLIAQSEANLARGYAYQDSISYIPQWQFCAVGGYNGTVAVAPQMCWVDQPVTVQRPVAIDLNAEAAKLNSLKAKRVQLANAAAPAVAQCQAQYPEKT